MDNLKEIVKTAMLGYAKKGLNSQNYFTHDDQDVMTVITVPQSAPSQSFVSLLARFIGSIVVIERDQNDKQLVDALEQLGVPRSQIILAYAGEAVPESAS